ncbi:MAG: hypothetical protein Q8N18_06225 [Opitutaceae bacterium]|nr:hypothetical protein [Opitutaceae bacterium]
MEEGFRLRPFTAVFVLAFAAAVVGGLIATFVFADTAFERWNYGLLWFSAAVLLGVVLAAVVRREERESFPLLARRALWAVLLLGYFIGIFLVLRLINSPLVPRLEAFRLAVGLGVIVQVPFYSWRLLRYERES